MIECETEFTESMYRTHKVGEPERCARPDLAPRAAKCACRTSSALLQSEVPHRCTPHGTCRADAARQREKGREGAVVTDASAVDCYIHEGNVDTVRTMVDNEFPAAEKILRDIENTIRRNPTM